MSRRNIDITSFPPDDIRNFSIISHVDHGKTTLSDHLIASGGMLPPNMAGNLRALDYLQSEQDRGITIESSLATFVLTDQDSSLLVNLIDTPGHVDFSGKVTEALHLVDNGLIIVDAVEGVMAQTTTVLHQAIEENLRLVLFINKIDRLITELQLDTLGIRRRIERIIGEVEAICLAEDYQDEVPNFANQRVLLGSALDGWGIDIVEAQQVGGIQEIFKWYSKTADRPSSTNLSTVFTRVIKNQFISPKQSQKRKFNRTRYKELQDKERTHLTHCDPQAPVYVLLGKKELGARSRAIRSVSRVLSGTISDKMRLYSVRSQKWVEIRKIIVYRGRKDLEIKQAIAGNVVGIEFSDNLELGDILTATEKKIELPQLDYIQKPVVSISIEPVDFTLLDEVIDELKLQSKINPGIEFQQNMETGELILSGLGNLQIELIVEELEEKGYELHTSDPQVIEYLIPTRYNCTERFEDYHITIQREKVKYGDEDTIFEFHENSLTINRDITETVIEAFHDEFKTICRIGPDHRGKIRDWHLTLVFRTTIPHTYEEAIVYARKILYQAAQVAELQIHRPHYQLEIITQERYVGLVSNEIQRHGGTIQDIETNEKSTIRAYIQVMGMGNLANTLRQVSDGNIIWKIQDIIYKEN